jgi:PAS domain S-box-containing protein
MKQFEAQSQMRGAQFPDPQEENSVLIANDLPEQLILMEGLLRKAGYNVFTAEDGDEAFDLAKQKQPDLVISDVRMPRVSGLQFCRLLRADTQLRSIPILLVSAQEIETANVVAGLRAGADDYLEIPFDGTRLVAKVARLIERARLEANYRDLVEQANDLIFTQDLAGRLTSINAAGSNFVGRKAEELLGNSFSSVFGAVGVDLSNNEFSKTPAVNELRHEFIAKRLSGEERWLDLTVSPIRNRLGEIVAFRGVARDVTKYKLAESALRDSEERYRLLFESTPEPICVYDVETLKFLTINEAAIRTYGYTREEFLSLTIDDISLEDQTSLSGPYRHQTKSKKAIYVEISSHPLIFDNKNAELVIINDVTERKLLEERQERMYASLQRSAMEWRQTFDAINFPVLIVDLEGMILRSNEAAEHIAGAQAQRLVGQSVARLGEGQPWKKAAELIEKIRETSLPVSEEVKDEVTGKTWTVMRFLVDEFGSVGDRAILIAQDISKRTELEASLRQSKMMSLLGSVVAGVAHEVRNPLFGISSILDAFEQRFSDRTEYSRYTRVLRDEIGRLTALMEELLEYGRPFRGDVYPVSLEEMITRSIRACFPVAKAAQVTLVNNVGNSLPRIMVDRRRLSSVFINLIENAIQHSASGGVVTVEAQKVTEGKENWIECSVKDLGPGIQPENLPKIFEPFFSTRRGGFGLGLAIAQKTMQDHGGELLARNNPGGGACMSARFPLPTEENAGG